MLCIIVLLYSGYRVSLLGVNRSGRGVDHPFPSSAEVKERAELDSFPPLCLRGLFRDELVLLRLPFYLIRFMF